MVVCPACGTVSLLAAPCGQCGHTAPGGPPAPRLCPLQPEGPLFLTAQQAADLRRPGDSALIRTQSGAWRVHWIGEPDLPLWQPRVQRRLACRSGALPRCRIVEDAGGMWVLAEATSPPQPMPWAARPASDPLEAVERLLAFLGPVASALDDLHAAGAVCLGFTPSALEFSGGAVRFTGLDVWVHLAGECPDGLEPDLRFAAPEAWRGRGEAIGPATDVFHLALLAYCWMARLLPQGIPGGGLPAFDFAVPPLRVYVPSLPPGLWPPLERALALEPAERFATPRELMAELSAAADRATRRRASTATVVWDVGAECRVGPVKAAAGRENEDSVLVREFAAPARTLAAVADGISTCDVGSGGLASRTACEALAEGVGEDCSAQKFGERVTAACQHAARKLLRWALEVGHRDALLAGKDLMGTTLTAAWVEGNEVLLANLGDSRAFLVDEAAAEQITVDGNVGSALLASGVPPEHVRDVGTMGRALREFVGGCVIDDEGQPAIYPRACTPALSRWKLLPGEVLVLCSDGLVEEGVFLSSQELWSLVRGNAELTAPQLATVLIEAAEARQGVPRPGAPHGYGDNVSCVVIKLAPG